MTYQSIAGEQELDLIRRYQAGDNAAGAVLLEAHSGFIISLTRRWHHRGVDTEDVLQEARMGFLRAVARFDPSTGFKLTTYAGSAIRREAQRAVEDMGSTVRVPNQPHQKIRDARRQGLTTAEEMVEAGLLRKDRAAGALAALGRTSSLDAPIRDDGTILLGDTLAADVPGPDEAYELAERQERAREEVGALLAHLDARERDVLLARFASPDDEEQTLKEIGERHGISCERIRQIQVSALEKLRRIASLRTLDGRALVAMPTPLQGVADGLDQALDRAREADAFQRTEDDAEAEEAPESEEEPATPAAPPAAQPPDRPLVPRLRAVRMPDGRSWFDVVEVVAGERGVDPLDVASRSRFKPNVRARAQVWWWLQNVAGAGYTAEFIAHVWGFSLPTVLDWIARHQHRIAVQAKLRGTPASVGTVATVARTALSAPASAPLADGFAY